MSLKQELISIGLVEDNQFLDKYCKLIEDNRKTKRTHFKTQCHHIIPRYYYKDNNLEVDNSKNNLVNLLYKDHVLAHYYLSKCSKGEKYKYYNSISIKHIFGNKNVNNNFNILSKEDQILIQKLYEESKKYFGNMISLNLKGKSKKPFTKSHIENISKGHKNLYKWIYKNDCEQMCYLSDLNKKLQEGWLLGRLPQTNKVIKKLSSTRKNRIYINKDGLDKRIYKNELEKYLKDGWNLGQCESHKLSVKNLVWMNDGNKSSRVQKEFVESYKLNGWNLGRIGWRKK